MFWLAAIPLAGLASWAGWRWWSGKPTVPTQLSNVLNFGGDPMDSFARRHDVDPALVRAVIEVESGGKAMQRGRPVIRFETHIFTGRRLPRAKRTKAKRRFRHGSPVWKQQAYFDGSKWVDLHTATSGQNAEYDALKLASAIDEHVAYQSISMGLGQLMGFHYETLGYPSPRAMFDDASRGESAQTRQMLSFIEADSRLIAALQDGDLVAFAAAYNGTGKLDTAEARKQADYYAGLIRSKWETTA